MTIKTHSPWREELDAERRQAPDVIVAALALAHADIQPALATARRIAADYDAGTGGAGIGLAEAREHVAGIVQTGKAFIVACRGALEAGAHVYGGTATNDPIRPAAEKAAALAADPLRPQIETASAAVQQVVTALDARQKNLRWPLSGALTLEAMTVGTAEHDFVQRCYAELWQKHRADAPGGDEGPFRRLVRAAYCLTETHRRAPDATFSGTVRQLAERVKTDRQ